MEFTCEGTEAAGFVANLIPKPAQEAAAETLGSRDNVEAELDRYLEVMQKFWQMEPDQVLITISAITARCTELCIHLHRVEHLRTYKRLRTMQAERIILEADRQFRLHSRLIEVRRQDLELSR